MIKPFDLVHFDLWGASPITSVIGVRYFLLFIDNYSRFTWIYLLKTKDETFPTFLKFKNTVATQFNSQIKALQSDWGGEYRPFSTFLHSHRIKHRVACPYTLQQNGRVERKYTCCGNETYLVNSLSCLS